MKSLRRFLTLLAAIAGLLLCGTAAKADSFSFTIDPATQPAVPGQTLTFFGTVGNPGASPIYLTGDTVTADAGLFVDDSQFLINFPPSLDSGVTTLSEELFSVLVLPGTPDGSYTGMFEILGGSDPNVQPPNDQDVLGAQGFTVYVTETPIPEPSSLLLLLSGLVGLGGTLRRRLTR